MSVWSKRQLLVCDEGSFMQYFNDTASLTWDKNLPVLSIDVDMPHERIMDQAIQADLTKRNLSHIGPHQPGTITFRMALGGHNTTAAGALAETALQQLLGDGLRGNSVATVGTTISGTASASAVVWDVVSCASIPVGAIVRLGVKGDGIGEGRAHMVSVSNTGATPDAITVLNAAYATPATNGTVVYATQLAYFDEDASQITKRFAFMHAGTGEQWVAFGCDLAGLKITYPPGNTPEVEFTYKVADFAPVAITFPNATAQSDNFYAPVAGESFQINAVGTTTLATITPSTVELNIELGLEATPGSAIGAYGLVSGWVRTGCRSSVTVRIPWSDVYRSWWDTANQSIVLKYFMFTASTVDGRANGIWAPSARPVGPRPNLPENVNGQTFVPVTFELGQGATVTSDLTKAPFVIWTG